METTISCHKNILSRTESLCPVCLEKIEASYVARDGKIFMEKLCPAHGEFSVLVCEDEGLWRRWTHPLADNRPKVCGHPVERGCPYDCGLCGEHRQSTCCVLLEVTQRCNMGCPVCFASAGETSAVDPDLERIAEDYDRLLAYGGPYNIQLSGGEPSLRDDLPAIIALGKAKGFSFFQLNTNGLRLADDLPYLLALAEAGLNTVFLQFDGLSERSFLGLRGGNYLAAKEKAIANCQKAKVGVVLVPTIRMGCNDDQIGPILEFAAKHMPTVRGVHFQPMSFFGRYGEGSGRITLFGLLKAIEAQTVGAMKATDFSPGNAEHALCSFHGDYAIREGRWVLRQSRKESCCVSSKEAREVVARKWSAPDDQSSSASAERPALDPLPSSCCYGKTDSLDAFLRERNESTLAISAMAFMDVWNLDLERLKQCYIHEVSPDGRLIPFCAYNLTAKDGRTLYRGAEVTCHG